MRVYRDDQKFLTFRINALLWAIVAVFVFLAGSFWFVQGVQAERYRNLSDANALRPLSMASHVIGFIGEVSERDLGQHKDFKQGDLIGKRGVEMMYDEYLRGRDGTQYWEYDSHGRRLAEVRSARLDPIAGNNVYLTIDFDLQRRAEQYFVENEFVGAVVAIDPRNGEVLAMVSSPAFNPNVYSKRFTPETWKEISSNPFKVELNRALQGLYSPGSVFKTVTAVAGLAEGAIGPGTTFSCGGSGVFFGRRFRCWRRQGHGEVSVANGLKDFCDIFFYNIRAR